MRFIYPLMCTLFSVCFLHGQEVTAVYPFSTYVNFEDVFVAEGGAGFAIGNCGTMATTANGTDWILMDAPISTYPLEMVACKPGTNCQVAWLAADDELLYTDDGGQSWTSIEVLGLDNPRELEFLNEDVAIISHSDASIFRSTDAGLTWTIVEWEDTSRGEPEFVNETDGFYLGQGDFKIYKTTDQGLTWDSIGIFPSQPQYISMATEQLGYVFMQNRNLFKTTDGGVNWAQVGENTVPASARHLFALDEDRIVASSFPSSLVFSNDGGETWEWPSAPLEEDAYGLRNNKIHRLGEQFWVASNSHSIIYSADALQTRTNVFAADREVIEAIQFAPEDPNIGYALCERRGLFKSMDAGASWERLETDFGVVSRDFLVRSADEVIIPYNYDGPQRTLDGGETWNPVFPAEIQDTTYVFQVEELPSGRLYFMGSVHAAYTDDDGASWNVQYHGLSNFAA